MRKLSLAGSFLLAVLASLASAAVVLADGGGRLYPG
jgi:hypothetical protein